ncbi:MAG: hypothetical protein KKB53_11305, partial [Acidobacteria bacterium]|nr:hypothetical protein [Acidobacteriota bacterium]MCG2815550.1 hypothetical protein [Candidatus Aminicenantes bacterium]
MDETSPLFRFFSQFKIALKNASIYSIDHPQTHQSVELLRDHLVHLAERIDPLHFVFTEHSLRFDDIVYSGHSLIEEIAVFFHTRKVKRLTIDGATSLTDLLAFFSLFIHSPQIMAEKGGLKTLIESIHASGFRIDELDYSSLLRGEGREIDNMREFILGRDLDARETEHIDRIAGRFSDILDEHSLDEWLSNPTLMANLSKIHESLKNRESPLLRPFSKSFVKSVLQSRTIPTKEELERLRSVLSTLNSTDFAGALWEEITENREFDALSLRVFSKLAEDNDPESISKGFIQCAERTSTTSLPPNHRNRILDLLEKMPSPLLSEVYRSTLSSLFQDIDIHEEQAFDRNIWESNFQIILLNYLQAVQNPENIGLIVNNLLLQWPAITKRGDLSYLKNMSITLRNKKRRHGSSENIDQLEGRMQEHIENQVLLGNPAIESLSSYFDPKKSRFSSNYILKKIFEGGIVNPAICELFFQSYPDDVFYFQLNAERELPDSPLLQQLIQALGQLESENAFHILRELYSQADITLQTFILQSLTYSNEPVDIFLTDALQKGPLPVRTAAFPVYAVDT